MPSVPAFEVLPQVGVKDLTDRASARFSKCTFAIRLYSVQHLSPTYHQLIWTPLWTNHYLQRSLMTDPPSGLTIVTDVRIEAPL